jgi:uncharacterized protein (UPF0261 family)
MRSLPVGFRKVMVSTLASGDTMPLKGVSAIGAPGGPFHSPEADESYFDALKQNLDPHIRLVDIDANINDESFARQVAESLLEMIGCSVGAS